MSSASDTQDEFEVTWLLAVMSQYNVQSVLEIGSHYGYMLKRFSELRPTKIRSIDINVTPQLRTTMEGLHDAGFDVDVLEADGRSWEAVKWAKACGPFDLIFIDDDHSVAGIQISWLLYQGMARYIAFHDIKGQADCPGVVALWEEIRKEYPTRECSMTADHFGIGLVTM